MFLITGGAGFIGSVIIKELNHLGREDITVVDRLRNTTKWMNLRGLKFERYIHADDLFKAHGNQNLSQVQTIIHMGACSQTTEMDMDFLMSNNVEYSKRLFEYATEKNIPIVYASSAATYGDGARGYDDDHIKISSLLPLNPYGYSKQLFDEWALRQRHLPSNWYGIKFFNVYGPNEYHKGHQRSIVHKSYHQIRDNGVVKLFRSHDPNYSDGEQLRDFVYVKDAARAVIKLLELNDSKHSGIYNIGTGKARSFNDLAESVFKALNKVTKIEYIDMPQGIRNQYQYFTEARMDKFLKTIPDFKFHSLEEGIFNYVNEYLVTDNPVSYTHQTLPTN